MVADPEADLRVTIGGPQCTQPYSASVLNISAMSFGALGEAAVRAMNHGAKAGGFAHDTGEGGLSRYHKEAGGDLIWQIGTGYFGCRDANGDFDPEAFRDERHPAAGQDDRDQGLPGRQARTRRHPPGGQGDRGDRRGPDGARRARTCSRRRTTRPSRRPWRCARSSPSCASSVGGKPVGFKICIGDPREFAGIVKAMLADRHLRRLHRRRRWRGRHRRGTPGVLRLPRRTAQRGSAGRSRTRSSAPASATQFKIGASGKMVTASAMARSMAMGADWCNSARAFMFAVGCIQSQRCHTNQCPVGVTTQDAEAPARPDRAGQGRAGAQLPQNTVHALAEMIAAMGLDHTSELRPAPRRPPGHPVPGARPRRDLRLRRAGGAARGDRRRRGSRRFWDEGSAESFRPWSAAEQAAAAGSSPSVA